MMAIDHHLNSQNDELAREIEADLERFVRGVPFEDDRTFVMVRRLSRA